MEPTEESRHVVVVGQGHVGLPLALRAAEAGFTVTGIDIDEQRVKRLTAGDSCVGDVPAERLAEALASGRYRASTDYADAHDFDVCVITVPVPVHDGVPDRGAIVDAGRAVAPHLRPRATVVLESTTAPGTTEELLRPVLEEISGLTAGSAFHLGYSPGRTDPGNPRWGLENTPKVVSGVNVRSLLAVDGFYSRIVRNTVPVSSPRTAELTKLIEDAFRQVNIALVNELATVTGPMGTDIREAIDAAATKPYGFLPFHPGPGVGGHRLPVPRGLLRFAALAEEINGLMPTQVVDRIAAGLDARQRPVDGSRVLLLGLAYKRDSGDLRESPALAIAAGLTALGAQVRAVEPYADPARLPADLLCVELTEEEAAAADVVVVATDHDVFDYTMVARAATYVFDTRNRCRGESVERL
ncbi:nucleotide sugar dehydrogenase [Streptomyces sp. NPDC008139]|uniref:nucleotide sugar dehydrogenase n=1 Tax=Streptomyces sp. NPDC008139 TaxID=3364814 RepID=UPI0036E0783C